MLEKFNSFMEKWMAFVTPACLLTGVLFPDIAKRRALCDVCFCIYDLYRCAEIQVP